MQRKLTRQLRSVDLNLLVVLDALLDEAHVSRAAARLGLSQPALSNALGRCRHMFEDPLLERGNGKLRLTPVARELRTPLKQLLAEFADIVDLPPPDLRTVERVVRLATADFIGEHVLRGVLNTLQRTAPGITLVQHSYNGTAATLEALENGSLDLAISIFPQRHAAFRFQSLFEDEWRVLLRKGHPAARAFDFEKWLEFPHILVAGMVPGKAPIDERLGSIGRRRRIGLTVPGFLMVPELVASSDLMATVPGRCVPPKSVSDLLVRPLPLELPRIVTHLAWHVRRDTDAVVRHVRQLIETLRY
jgi:DNA-binding transcriptional LysR family regulator